MPPRRFTTSAQARAPASTSTSSVITARRMRRVLTPTSAGAGVVDVVVLEADVLDVLGAVVVVSDVVVVGAVVVVVVVVVVVLVVVVLVVVVLVVVVLVVVVRRGRRARVVVVASGTTTIVPGGRVGTVTIGGRDVVDVGAAVVLEVDVVGRVGGAVPVATSLSSDPELASSATPAPSTSARTTAPTVIASWRRGMLRSVLPTRALRQRHVPCRGAGRLAPRSTPGLPARRLRRSRPAIGGLRRPPRCTPSSSTRTP
jgi:hypothetical protein